MAIFSFHILEQLNIKTFPNNRNENRALKP